MNSTLLLSKTRSHAFYRKTNKTIKIDH